MRNNILQMGTIFDSIILRQILVETTTGTPITPTQKQRKTNFEARQKSKKKLVQCDCVLKHENA